MEKIKIKMNTKLLQQVMKKKRYKNENCKICGGTRARHTANKRRLYSK